MSDWKHADIVLDQQTNAVYEFVRFEQPGSVPVWNQLSPPGPYGYEGDLHKPVLLCRYHGGKRLPTLDLEGLAKEYPPARCFHEAGATWAGKCVDCGSVCAPNLDDEAERALDQGDDTDPDLDLTRDGLLPYFGAEDESGWDGAA